jgi:hypothetical protein
MSDLNTIIGFRFTAKAQIVSFLVKAFSSDCQYCDLLSAVFPAGVYMKLELFSYREVLFY